MTTRKFDFSFDSYVCEGDYLQTEIDGITFLAMLERDEYSHVNDFECYSDHARKAWFNNEWFYCTIYIGVRKNGTLIDSHVVSLSGIEANYPESDNAHLTEVADELLNEAIPIAKEELKRLKT